MLPLPEQNDDSKYPVLMKLQKIVEYLRKHIILQFMYVHNVSTSSSSVIRK